MNKETRYKLSFKPQHAIPMGNQIRIQFPWEFTLLQTNGESPCSLTAVPSTVSSTKGSKADAPLLTSQTTCFIELTTNELIINNVNAWNKT